MPHYKDGTEARVGDVVKGSGYNIKHEIIGMVTRVTPGASSCNLTIACVGRSPHGAQAEGVAIPALVKDGVATPIENFPLETKITTEYGQADAFEKIA